jgi:hypothetical protein
MAAWSWNLDEVRSSTSQRQAWADYIRQLAYYRDNITVHNGPSWDDSIYGPLLGYARLTGPEIQWDQGTADHTKVLEWRNKSHANGHRWVVSLDEPWSSTLPTVSQFRSNNVWGSYMAGAAGCELFVEGDGSLDDFHPYASYYTTVARARKFLQDNVPYTSMDPNDGLVSGATAYVLAKIGQVYSIYLTAGGAAQLNLSGVTGSFDVLWFDPRNGGGLQSGSIATVTGGGVVSLGQPPASATSDWTVLVRTRIRAPTPPTNVRIIP